MNISIQGMRDRIQDLRWRRERTQSPRRHWIFWRLCPLCGHHLLREVWETEPLYTSLRAIEAGDANRWIYYKCLCGYEYLGIKGGW